MARNYRFGLPLHKCMLCSPMHAMIPTQRPSSLTSFKYAMIHFQFSPNLDPIPATDPQVQFRFPFRIHNPRVSERIFSYGYENGEMRAVTFIIYITFYCRFTLSLACIFGEKSSSGIIIMIFLCFRIKLYHWVNHQIRKNVLVVRCVRDSVMYGKNKHDFLSMRRKNEKHSFNSKI